MAEIEKKYSDYQESECEGFERDSIQPVDEKLCPTCQPNPNFVLEGNWWDIEDAYLNEKHCEYHVRVYRNEKAVKEKGGPTRLATQWVAAGRILVDFDKPLNDATRLQVQNAAYIKDKYINTGSGELGEAYLIAVPAFNFDQIEPNDSENAQDNDAEETGGGEIILSTDRLYRKIRQLRRAIITYGWYYGAAQKVGSNFVIRQEQDEVLRIDYKDTAQKIQNFLNLLSDALSSQGYPRLHHTGWFKAKSADKIKIVFKDNNKPFDVKGIYVLPNNGCDKYEKLKIKSGNGLKKPSMAVVYNFLQNLDQVINDITAKDTKPWLEFTLDNFYPQYVVDYGDIESIDNSRAGLECLLQDSLGIGNGQIIDSLTKEILSAFDTLEQELAKEICRAKKADQSPITATQIADKKQAQTSIPSKEREAAIRAKYEKEYKNQFLKFVKGFLEKENKKLPETSPPKLVPSKINLQNVFSETKKADVIIQIFTPKPIKVSGVVTPYNSNIFLSSTSQLENEAKIYANWKFNLLEKAEGIRGFGNQIQQSPHYDEAKEAAREVLPKFENTYFGELKDVFEGKNPLNPLDLISVFGICGMSKVAGKALECLLGGVTFDRFLGILIEKTFDFMEINTLSLFMNGLPADFREDLNAEIEKQFGGISLSDLFELKKAEGGSQKVKEVVKVRGKKNQAIEIYKENKPWSQLTQTQKDLITSLTGRLGDGRPNIEEYEANLNSFNSKVDENREFKEDYLESKFKREISPNLDSRFTNGVFRIRSSLDSLIIQEGEEELNRFEQSVKSFEETALGVKVDAVFDVVFDFAIDYVIESLSLDDLYARLTKYPVVDFVAGLVEKYFDSCPTAPIIYPPPGDFLKGLKLDICDPTISLTLPAINIPSINWKFLLETQFKEIFREAIIKIVSEIVIKILKKLLLALESALCNMLEATGKFAADALKNGLSNTVGGLYNSFLDALNEAFCNDGQNPETAEDRAKELADALFSPILFDAGQDYEGSGGRVANIISSVAGTEEFLAAMVAREGEEDLQFNNTIANAINALAPEMNVLLGDPNQVAYFFRNLGSYLTPEDRDRIRDLLDAGIPNLPLSPALCLTNDQLNEWDNFRNQLLQDPFGDGSGRGGLTPEQAADAVRDLNDRTAEVLGDIMDIVGDLDTDGPFLGSLTNEMMKDVCNPNNVVNPESQSSFDREQENELVENFFDNIQRSLMNGFMNRGGILAEATADVEGRIEFWRSWKKIFHMNYTNSAAERETKYNSLPNGLFPIRRWIMDNQDDGKARGVYPQTVAIKQRKEALEQSNRVFNGSKNSIELLYTDSSGDFAYKFSVKADNTNNPKSFNFKITANETIDDEEETILSVNVPVSLSQDEIDFMSSQGFQIISNDKEDLRKEFFVKYLQKKTNEGLSRENIESLYEQTVQMVSNNLFEALLTNDNATDGIPVGYQFGYVSDTLVKEDFEYTPSDNEEELGTFGNPKIIPLDPAIYGGSYKRPAFYVEPRVHTGWVELGTKAFSTTDGCEPKRPPLFNMRDIKERVKTLNSSLRVDPRLSKPSECVSVKPFHLLLDNKNKAKLDGVVRTTLRTYIGEYFIKGYGLFSNLQIREANFDQSMMLYIIENMKKEMQDLGVSWVNSRIKIVRERYWYTFLEQCVEAYQRMVDVDGVQPPEAVSTALNRIQLGLDRYFPIGPNVKKRMRKVVSDGPIRKPGPNYDPLEVISGGFDGMVNLGLQAVAFRLTDVDKRDDFFNGGTFDDIGALDIRFASIKKLQFFQKIYFIKLFEKEATLIMSEFIRDELNRLADNVVDGINDKPVYYDLNRAFFGMKSFFPNSTSRIGFNQFYTDKQRGEINTGNIPQIKSSNATFPIEIDEESSDSLEKPRFVIESYVRLEENSSADIPNFIRNRQAKYLGAVSLSDMSEFISTNLDLMDGKYLSDYFGSLTFTYEARIKELFDKGFANETSVNRLVELNRGRGAQIPSFIRSALNAYVLGREFENIVVTYDESFLLDGENPTPTGTIGTTGVKYGMRLCLVLPASMSSTLPRSTELMNKSRLDKTFFFEDGTVVVPLIETEVDVIDAPVEEFDPFNGSEPYDLECLINKMTSEIEFKFLMEKILNFRQAASMLAIYCMETLPAAIGRDETEREEVDGDPDVGDWDRVVNKFGKNFLRREFKSLYLANHEDGQSDDDDDDSERMRLLRMGNPFDFFSLPSVRLPWWFSRRMKTKIYDANGQECADPKKDLQ